jgi:hypothetical protein
MSLYSDSIHKLRFLLLLILVSVSCGNKDLKSKKDSGNVLVGKKVDLELDGVFSTYNIHVIDSLIIIQEMGNTYTFSVYNINTLKLIGKFGKQGRGPAEYHTPEMMKQKIVKRDSACLIVCDFSQKRFDSINILRAINRTNYYPKSFKYLNKLWTECDLINSAVITSDSFIVGNGRTNRLGYVTKGRFFCYNFLNDKIIWEPFFPVPEIAAHPRMQDILYMSQLALRPDGNEIAASTLFFERIDILDKKGKLERSVIFENSDDKPDFSSTDKMPPQGVHEYFTSVSVTQDYIYALNIDLDTKNTTIIDTVSLVKSSWDEKGIPPEIYKLTPRLSKIAVDVENRKVYGIQQMGSGLYIYDLK